MRYKVVIFDWDGTLMDSTPKIVACMQQAARNTGESVPEADAVKQIIGLSLAKAVEVLFGIQDRGRIEALVEQYKTVFIHHDQTPSPMFDGAQALLSKLREKGHALAVATGKARRGLERAWSQTDTRDYFIASRCADEAESKPHPDMLEQLLAHFGVSVSEAVMVGDTSHDMGMAEAIGMDRIAMTHGAHSLQQLIRFSPVAICDDLQSLGDFLINLPEVQN